MDAELKQFNPCHKDAFFPMTTAATDANGDPDKLHSKLCPPPALLLPFLVINADERDLHLPELPKLCVQECHLAQHLGKERNHFNG